MLSLLRNILTTLAVIVQLWGKMRRKCSKNEWNIEKDGTY
jgi:hypothetical protein